MNTRANRLDMAAHDTMTSKNQFGVGKENSSRLLKVLSGFLTQLQFRSRTAGECPAEST
jgi:hypothetical protein